MTDAMTEREIAAMTVVAILGDSTNLGVAKWPLVASRIRVAAQRAETPLDVWVEVAPHLRSLGSDDLSKAAAADLLAALAVPGVLSELALRLDLAVLRVRAARQSQPKPLAPDNQETLL